MGYYDATIGRSKQSGFVDKEAGKAWMFANNPLQAFNLGFTNEIGSERRPSTVETFASGGGAWVSRDWKASSKKEKTKSAPVPNKSISTFALNAGQAIAGLGDSIPILFGKYTGTSGGFVTAPSAVYQRMHSQGVFEWCRTAFVIGEGGVVLNPADERGVRTGTKSLSLGDDRYWSYLFTDGLTANNDPTLANTIGFGQFKSFEDVTPANQFLGGTISGGEVRCFSQTFDGNEAFGFSGEEPECDGGESGQPAGGQIQPLNLNVVRATISNTRSVKVTEFGLAVNLRTVGSDGNDVAPVGSLWVANNSVTGQLVVYRIVSIAQKLASTLPYLFRSNDANKLENSERYSKLQKQWDEGMRYAQILDSDLRPVTVNQSSDTGFQYTTSILSIKGFVEKIGTRYAPYSEANRNRTNTPATGFAMPAPNSCAPPDYLSILSDTTNPKMMFRIFWRPFSSTSNSWRELTRKPLVAACVDATVMFTTLKIQHPTESAAEFRFEPVTPDEFARDFMQYNELLGEEGIEYVAESNGDFPIIYDRNSSPVRLDLNDGYKLEFAGGFSNFFGNVDIDGQTANYSVGISYVNEILPDAPKYPFMATAVLNTRGYKGMSSQGALSVYYDNGADIQLLETGLTGPSNLFPELANYLLTTFPGATSGAVPVTAIDTASFLKAITFTRGKELFYDGVIENRSGAFEFIADNAEFFLLRFGMNQGLYSFFIATEDSAGSGGTAAPNQVLTLSDIIADSFSIEYATLKDREPAFVNVTYRHQEQYLPGEQRTVTVAPDKYTGSNVISYDLSEFCTTEKHAATYAKFALASRVEITHTVQFTTFLDRIDLMPGRLFKFDLTVETSAGKTYTNQDQYQIISTAYQQDGTVAVSAAFMPKDFSSLVLGDTYRIVR